jgi:hypothetical protein
MNRERRRIKGIEWAIARPQGQMRRADDVHGHAPPESRREKKKAVSVSSFTRQGFRFSHFVAAPGFLAIHCLGADQMPICLLSVAT